MNFLQTYLLIISFPFLTINAQTVNPTIPNPSLCFNTLEFIDCNLDIDPEVILRDTDEDGVIDYYETEPNSPYNAAVDITGKMIDSDNDGCFDHEDIEPLSSSEFPIENCINLNSNEAFNFDIYPDLNKGGYADLHMPNLYYNRLSSKLDERELASLYALVELLLRYPQLSIRIGFSDYVHPDESDIYYLNEERARKVASFFLDRGVSENKVCMMYEPELIKNEYAFYEFNENRPGIYFRVYK